MVSTAKNIRPQVIVVGAGPSGLATAIELGSRSIQCLIIERNDRVGYAPRAKTTHTRTREHLRRWGIADRLAEEAPFGTDFPSHIAFVTRLSGFGITRFDNALNCSPARDERYSEHSQWIPQYKLEAVLRDHAATLPSVEMSFGQEFVSFEQDAHSVSVRVRDVLSGAERTIDADFLVGADGARSSIRDAIGAEMIGTYGLSRNYNTIFRAPGLLNAHKHGPAIQYWQLNADVPSLLGPMDKDDLWFFMPTKIPEGAEFSFDEVASLIRTATGIDLDYEILSSDLWVASRLIADRYSSGRVFLIGDACHLHPPFGGYGMNMGVADAVDLGWKLAACLQGWGGANLLASYEAERRPAHKFVLDEAEANHAVLPNQMARAGIEDDTPEGAAIRQEVGELIWEKKHKEFYSLGVMLGYCYRESPIIAYDRASEEWRWSRDYEPSAVPGCVAPHHWLDDGRSLYDLFGPDFSLLVFDDVFSADIDQAIHDATTARLPVKIVRLKSPLLADRYCATRVLIRPDQHVAWRGNVWPGAALLRLVTGKIDSTANTSARSAGLNA